MKDMRNVLNEILGEDLTHGEALRAALVKAGISQDELQEITGIARSNIRALENGRIEMTAHYALLFAEARKHTRLRFYSRTGNLCALRS